MARKLDLGEPDDPVTHLTPDASSRPQSCSAATLVWSRQGQKVTTHLLRKAVATCGRASDRDICLRVEPTELPANCEKTFHISINHCMLRFLGDRVEIIDTHSTNGTSLKSVGRLQPGLAVPVSDGDVISVADALTLQAEFGRRSKPLPPDESMAAQLDAKKDDVEWLNDHLIGREKPGILDYVRLRRLDNLPEEEYVLLFGVGNIGRSGTPLIPLDADAAALPHVRTLDLGDTPPDYPAGVYWAGKALHIHCNLADQVRINGTAVSAGEDKVLSGGETIEVLGQSIKVAAQA